MTAIIDFRPVNFAGVKFADGGIASVADMEHAMLAGAERPEHVVDVFLRAGAMVGKT